MYLEGLAVARPHDVPDGDDVLVLQVAQQLDLAQHPPRVHHVVERVAYFLDGHLRALRPTTVTQESMGGVVRTAASCVWAHGRERREAYLLVRLVVLR